jgi:hypothetical protein
MVKFQIFINQNLIHLLKEIEAYFSIYINQKIIDKIFQDSDEDQVNEKEYLILEKEQGWLQKPIIIEGKVDSYEPDLIRIIMHNLNKKDTGHFNIWLEERNTML